MVIASLLVSLPCALRRLPALEALRRKALELELVYLKFLHSLTSTAPGPGAATSRRSLIWDRRLNAYARGSERRSAASRAAAEYLAYFFLCRLE